MTKIEALRIFSIEGVQNILRESTRIFEVQLIYETKAKRT